MTDRADKRKREDTNPNLEVASKIPKLQNENYILEKNYLQGITAFLFKLFTRQRRNSRILLLFQKRIKRKMKMILK